MRTESVREEVNRRVPGTVIMPAHASMYLFICDCADASELRLHFKIFATPARSSVCAQRKDTIEYKSGPTKGQCISSNGCAIDTSYSYLLQLSACMHITTNMDIGHTTLYMFTYIYIYIYMWAHFKGFKRKDAEMFGH